MPLSSRARKRVARRADDTRAGDHRRACEAQAAFKKAAGHRGQRYRHQRGAAGRSWWGGGRAQRLVLAPMARIISYASAPLTEGWASSRARGESPGKASLASDTIASSSSTSLCLQSRRAPDLGLDPAKVNVNGVAIALGHPIARRGGAAGDVLHALRSRENRYGMVPGMRGAILVHCGGEVLLSSGVPRRLRRAASTRSARPLFVPPGGPPSGPAISAPLELVSGARTRAARAASCLRVTLVPPTRISRCLGERGWKCSPSAVWRRACEDMIASSDDPGAGGVDDPGGPRLSPAPEAGTKLHGLYLWLSGRW